MSRAQLRLCSQGTLFLKDRPTRIGVGSRHRLQRIPSACLAKLQKQLIRTSHLGLAALACVLDWWMMDPAIREKEIGMAG